MNFNNNNYMIHQGIGMITVGNGNTNRNKICKNNLTVTINLTATAP